MELTRHAGPRYSEPASPRPSASLYVPSSLEKRRHYPCHFGRPALGDLASTEDLIQSFRECRARKRDQQHDCRSSHPLGGRCGARSDARDVASEIQIKPLAGTDGVPRIARAAGIPKHPMLSEMAKTGCSPWETSAEKLARRSPCLASTRTVGLAVASGVYARRECGLRSRCSFLLCNQKGRHLVPASWKPGVKLGSVMYTPT